MKGCAPKSVEVRLTQGLGPGPAEGAGGGGVRVDGNPIPGADSILDIKVEVLEFREGGQPGAARLVPGPKKYGLSIVLAGRIQIFDNELPPRAQGDHFP